MAERIMAKYPHVFFQLQPTASLEFLFLFCLRVLSGKEPLPKATAADFWVGWTIHPCHFRREASADPEITSRAQTGFLTLKSEDTGTQATIASATETLGPMLAQALVQNIGGRAARSELDKLSDPLKKLVVQHPRAQAWLERALLDEAFPGAQVSREERLLFLRKLSGYVVAAVGWVHRERRDIADLLPPPTQTARGASHEPGRKGVLAGLPGVQLCVCLMTRGRGAEGPFGSPGPARLTTAVGAGWRLDI